MATYDEAQLSKRLCLMPGTALGASRYTSLHSAAPSMRICRSRGRNVWKETRLYQQVVLGLWERALLAQTKDYSNWKLPGRVAEKATAAS